MLPSRMLRYRYRWEVGRAPNMKLKNLWLIIGFVLVMLVIVASLTLCAKST